MNGSALKFLSLATTFVGIGGTLLSDWVDDKKLDKKVEDKVNEALAEKENPNDEEEES